MRQNIADEVVEIHFSNESGFYEDEFWLTISSNRGEIYYTLDGSIPTKESYKYDGAILIKDATEDPNTNSLRTDLSPAFRKDLLDQYSPHRYAPDYVVPNYNIDKCTVVRAVVYLGNDRYSLVKTASFFVGFDDKYGYDNMQYVSIVADPYDLFDYNDGIYVNGKTFDDYAKNIPSMDVWYWEQSDTNSTREFSREIEGSCQFFSGEGDLLLSQACGIRIHGGGSRQYNPKSLSLFSRKEYDGNIYFNYNFFENDYRTKKLMLTQGGDDYVLKIRDYMVNCLASDLDVSTAEYIPYVMFLNGEYWGVYWLVEKYDEEYFHYHYDVDRDNIIMIKNDEIEIGSIDDIEEWNDMIELCSSLDLTDSANYTIVQDMIDIESYIDYYATLIYVGRTGDWPSGNYAAWRCKKVGSDEYEDGKWRWVIFDVNSYSMMYGEAENDTIRETMDNDVLFANLMINNSFRNDFLDRMQSLRDDKFSSENVFDFIDEYEILMSDSLSMDQKRFFGSNSFTSYDDIEDVKLFFEKRDEYIIQLIDAYR